MQMRKYISFKSVTNAELHGTCLCQATISLQANSIVWKLENDTGHRYEGVASPVILKISLHGNHSMAKTLFLWSMKCDF